MHRKSLAGRNLFLLVALLLLALPLNPSHYVAAEQKAPTTPMSVAYQINPAHTGNLQDPALKLPLKQLWAVEVGDAVSYPLVVGDKVFVTSATRLDFQYGSRLHALDARTGATVWGPVELGGVYWWTALAYDRGKVFALNHDGLLRAYDADTGTPSWSLKLPNQRSFSAPPVAYNGIVYTSGEGEGGTLYAVDDTNGNLLWTAPVGTDHGSPAVTDSAVYAGYECEAYAFAARTGKALWTQHPSCSSSMGGTTSYYNGKVYVRGASPPGVLAVDAATGKQIQIYTAQRTPVFDGSRFFLFMNGNLQGLDEATGRVLWTFAGDGDLGMTPIVVNGTLYVVSMSGVLYGLDPSTGAVTFRTSLPVGISREATDEWNGRRTIGMGAGNGRLIIPISNQLVALDSAPPGTTPSGSYGCQKFDQTAQTVCHKFLEYWTTHGGVAQQGFPISGEVQERSDIDGHVYTVQYFERAVFEYHPKNPAPNDVLLSLLGVFAYKQKYSADAPGQTADTGASSVIFNETGKHLGGIFLEYWKSHGGVAQQGLPISEPFLERSGLDGKTYLVQYFERAVFEYHPELAAPNDVLLSQLGTVRYQALYQGPNAQPVRPATTPVP